VGRQPLIPPGTMFAMGAMFAELSRAAAETTSATPVSQLLQELGGRVEEGTQEIAVPIDQGAPRKSVTFQPGVLVSAVRPLRSPQYLATIRRREAGRIAHLIAALEQRASDEHFAVWTQEPLDRIRRLIEQLSHAEEYAAPEHEANSCEILRQLRDTLLESGWERYREARVREAAVTVLKRLAVAEAISADDAFRAMDRLLDMGLRPVLGLASSDEGEDELPC